jgi:hypothetical protein
VGTAFTNTPYLYTVDNTNRRETSLRIFAPQSVPEPSTLILLGLGLVGMAGVKRKFRS